jgi:hypothetical protein
MTATTADGAPATRLGGADRPVRTFFWVWGHAMLLTALGGGACGLVSAGFVSVALLFWTIPGGMVLGLGLGLPLGLAIATVVVTGQATLPSEATTLTRELEWIGVGIAVAVVSSTSAYLLGYLTLAPDIQLRALGIAAQIPNGMIAVTAAAFIGRECGYRLARRYVRRFGQEPPRRLPILRSRHLRRRGSATPLGLVRSGEEPS